MVQPWNTYPGFGNYGSFPDPFGNYPKPDINVCAPGGTPITAILPGTVTGNTTPSWAGGFSSVTVQLDKPVNSLATHSAYNFIQSAVRPGQRVNTGDLIGYASANAPACTAFALTNDSVYGTTTFQKYAGNPQLNPLSYLGSQFPNVGSISGGTATGTTSLTNASTIPIIGPIIDWINNTIVLPIQTFFSQFSTVFQWLSNPIRIVKMVAGISLLLVAMYMLISPAGEKVGKIVLENSPAGPGAKAIAKGVRNA